MLGDKGRMTTHWGLTTIVDRLRGREPVLDEFTSVLQDQLTRPLVEVVTVLRMQSEATSERTFRQGIE
jgi:hypothetical protein